jgi:outer membrane protein assembly factor BamB
VIINTSVTIAAGFVGFVESRNAAVKALDTRRIGAKELWLNQFLVVLDLKTGRLKWERPIDTDDGVTMFSMAHASGKFVVVASNPAEGGRFHVATFDAAVGRPGWEARVKWAAKGKGAHSSRPTIVGEIVYVWPYALDLATGKQLHKQMVRGTCGSYAAAKEAIISRIGNLGMWSPATGKTTTWARLRSDCWLSTIPAAGMVLSPEGGGGCSCGGWLETSVGFSPVKAAGVSGDGAKP